MGYGAEEPMQSSRVHSIDDVASRIARHVPLTASHARSTILNQSSRFPSSLSFSPFFSFNLSNRVHVTEFLRSVLCPEPEREMRANVRRRTAELASCVPMESFKKKTRGESNSACQRNQKHKVLRAKYFADDGTLKVGPKHGMSYTWRSVLKGVQLLKEGIIWRVGNGQSIDIWHDPWIPGRTTRRVITRRGGCLLSRVAELINTLTGSWDIELVSDIFWPEDQDTLAIPVYEDMDDMLAWGYDRKGLYSVKSAYMVDIENEQRTSRRGEGQCSSNVSQCIDWKSIWELPCPGKIHHFFWRFAHSSLPVR